MSPVIVFLLTLFMVVTPIAAQPTTESFAIKEPNPVTEVVTLWAVCYMWNGVEDCTRYMPRDEAETMLAHWNELYPEWVGMFYLRGIDVELDDPAITM